MPENGKNWKVVVFYRRDRISNYQDKRKENENRRNRGKYT
jgi:hypothetical protein